MFNTYFNINYLPTTQMFADVKILKGLILGILDHYKIY